MKIFITGIAGFIGFHLALFLKERGIFVMGCDNFNSYYDPALKRKRVSLLEDIEVIDADINQFPEHLLDKYQITHIIHLAAQAGVRYSITHPEKYVDSNLTGFTHILEICRKHPQIKLIYASSSSVYGLNKKIPFSETDPTDHPASFYGATKKCNEILAHSYHHLYGISCTGLRFFTVYGPWGRPDMAYFSFTKAILEGKSISVYGNGELKRDFTYIDDIIRGINGAIELSPPWEIINLGNNKPQTVNDLISIIERETGKKAIVEYLPKPPGDVDTTYADISKAQNLLNFSPSTSLEEGISQFIQWYSRNYLELPPHH